MLDIDTREREILRLLWQEGRLSRWELHERSGVNPNAIGVDVATLLNQGLVRECRSEPLGPGRPPIPLEIDPLTRHVVGLAISPGRVEAGRLSLRGSLLGRPLTRQVSDPAKLVPTAQRLLEESINDQTVSIGLSVTGFVDPVEHVVLTSSSIAGYGPTSLTPLYETAGELPVVLENNTHAMAACWLLTHQGESDEDVLLVDIYDGQLGAALLVGGRPNRGCIIGANELGHMRFFVDTDVCYCGHPGCLERIVSTEFLRRRGVKTGTLMELAAGFEESGPVMREILDYLSAGLANAINFARPNRLVLSSDLTRAPAFIDALLVSIRSRLLNELAQRVRIDLWDQVDSHSAETAGWLGLSALYREGWDRVVSSNGR
jgi:predicted NBD/HSP70 family sugar kinase